VFFQFVIPRCFPCLLLNIQYPDSVPLITAVIQTIRALSRTHYTGRMICCWSLSVSRQVSICLTWWLIIPN